MSADSVGPTGTARPGNPWQVSPFWANAFVVAGGSAVAIFFALQWAPSVFLDTGVVPTGHDSFYHAARVMDAVRSPSGIWDGLVQFDPRIHAPEGSWVTWPWAYDGLLALFVKWAGLAGIPHLVSLVYSPVLAIPLSVLLVLAVGRELRWSVPLCAIAVGLYAANPMTQQLHGLGRIDHHYVEELATLAVLWLGLRWLLKPERPARAFVLGFALGAANALYNGLFVLMLPMLGVFALTWLRGELVTLVTPRSLAAWAGGVLIGTLLAVVPSEPWQHGLFAYYLLSWFHVYVMCSAVLVALLFHRWPRSLASVGLMGLVAALLTAPLLAQLGAGLTLVAGTIPGLSVMTDVYSPITALADSPHGAAQAYSGLIFLLPIMLGWILVQLVRPRPAYLAYLALVCLLGLGLFLSQHRFHQYGGLAFYLVPVALLGALTAAFPRRRPTIVGMAVILATAASTVSLSALLRHPVPGFSAVYHLTRDGYAPLKRSCADSPRNSGGVVLAESGVGHYARFHSECAVLGNNFLTTTQHLRAIARGESLLAGTEAALRANAPWIDYVWLVRGENVLDLSVTADQVDEANQGLRSLLLLDDPDTSFELVWERSMATIGAPVAPAAQRGALARLYRVNLP